MILEGITMPKLADELSHYEADDCPECHQPVLAMDVTNRVVDKEWQPTVRDADGQMVPNPEPPSLTVEQTIQSTTVTLKPCGHAFAPGELERHGWTHRMVEPQRQPALDRGGPPPRHVGRNVPDYVEAESWRASSQAIRKASRKAAASTLRATAEELERELLTDASWLGGEQQKVGYQYALQDLKRIANTLEQVTR